MKKLLVLAISFALLTGTNISQDIPPQTFEVAEVLPEQGAITAANQAITVIFNRPIVPVVSVQDMASLPDPLIFLPEAEGTGEWLNTAIYVFTPTPAWRPDTQYTVTIDPTLVAANGATLGIPFSWTFQTEPPSVITFLPEASISNVDLDRQIEMVLGTNVDRASFERSFFLRKQSETGGSVSGTFEWATDEGTDYEGTGWIGVAFEPDELLELDTVYDAGFPADSVFDATRSVTFPAISWNFRTVPHPAIIGSDPFDGQEDVPPFGGISIFFASPMDETTLNDKVTIKPEPWREPEFFYQTYNDALFISFPTEPSTSYTISVEPGMEDIYGNVIITPFQFSYITAPYNPDVSLRVPGPVGFYSAYQEETKVFVTHRNITYLDLNLFDVSLEEFTSVATGDNYYDPTQSFAPRPDSLLQNWQIESVAPENALRYELLSLGSSVDGFAPNIVCEGALTPRVRVGDTAIVITESDPLRARSAPIDGEVVDLLYQDYQLPIVSGPVCDDTGIIWWEIQLRDENTAWVAEGVGDEYFIDLHIPQMQTPVTIPKDFTNGESLRPGIYYLTITSPETISLDYRPDQHFMVVATANLTIKSTTDSMVVWATDVQTGQPIPNAPITIYGTNLSIQAEGVTDANGIVQFELPPVEDLYIPRMAVLDTDEHFGMGSSGWSDGIDPWQFNQPYSFYPLQYRVYLYTDRPVYRPDQPVYFRGIVRQKDDVAYTPPPFVTVPVEIFDDRGEIIYFDEVPLTEYGTFNGSFDLAADASLGFYRMRVDLPTESRFQYEGGSVSFNVAEFRSPEFQVELIPLEPEVVQGDTIEVKLNSRYFFGGAVSDATVEYNVVANPFMFNYTGPGGRYNFTDFDYDSGPSSFYGSSSGRIANGEVTTDSQGNATIAFNADLEDAIQSQRFTVEATVRDESNQVVAGRTSVVVHQGLVYVGVRPERYVTTAGSHTTMNLISVDWESNPVPKQDIDIEVMERRWSSVQEEDPSGRTVWTWEVEEITVADGNVTTDDAGRADWAFVAPYGGIFKVTATSHDNAGNEIRTSTTVWVSSQEYVSWRQQNSNRIDLIADANDYSIGDTAEILIPSPFQGTVEALITVERGNIISSERITMESNSYVYQLPITDDFAPNAFVSVMLVKGVDETNPVTAFRMGTIQLGVDAEQKTLNIEITPDVEQATPGDTVTFTIKTTNYQGEPVPAEVGVALTDLASLSVGERNSPEIFTFFYGTQSLAIRTATILTMNTDQITQTVLDTIKGGGGGFGEGGIFDIREEFIDTAYWNGALVTDADGIASFGVTLPDNLTTWRLDAKGLTLGADGHMLIGEETFDLLSTKPLLVRPITPRFLVVGDELHLTAIVNNNTDSAQSVEVTLQASGVILEGDITQVVTIPAGERRRVDWPVAVDNVKAVDLTFFAASQNENYSDASKPPLGQGIDKLLPVYRYEAPEITGTGGVLRQGGTQTETILLPQDLEVSQGELTVNVEPSLAATTLDGLEVIRNQNYDNIEMTVSRFLPNIMTFRALDNLSLANEDMRLSLDFEVNIAIQRLAAQQKVDGGWGWHVQDDSHPIVTAYALIGVVEAQNMGFTVDQQLIQRAQGYLNTQFIVPNQNTPIWQLDRQAFILYALARSGAADIARTSTLYDNSARMSLYAKGLLTQTLHIIGRNDNRIHDLVANITNRAIASANGLHWEENDRDYFNWNTHTRTTAILLSTLVQVRPDSELIPNIVRWLMMTRTADVWETSQETAWALLGLADWMVASGELNADYDYSLLFNGEEQLARSATPDNIKESDRLVIDVVEMLQDEANNLTFVRSDGNGNLYYTAYLRVFLPVPEIDPLNRGIIVQRRYTLLNDENRESLDSARVGDLVQVHLTIIAPNDLHFVVIEDPIPAGTEAVDPGLMTSQQIGTRPGLDQDDPLSYGWGWWWFSKIEFHDEKIVLNATYLPAGTYEYVYTIRPGLEGVYNVMPPTGREFYFPDVFGRGTGSTFSILPE